MANGTTDVAAALEAAVSGSEASATSKETAPPVASTTEKSVTPAEGQPQSTEKGKQPGPIPYERFHEKVEQFNQSTEKIKDLETKLAAAVDREDSLRSKVVNLEKEAGVLESIRSLADEDEEWRPTLEKLDKRLRGIEEEVEEGTKTKQEGAQEATDVLANAKKELEEKFEDQQTDFIVMQARELADKYLRNLPEEYTAEERHVIGEMLTPRVNWDKVAENPVDLPQILAAGLKETLETYGEPRGALSSKLKELEETREETSTVETPEQIAKRLAETDWAEVVESGRTRKDHVTGDDVAIMTPKQSEQDFEKALADVLKLGNR